MGAKTPKEDCEELMRATLPLAKKMLAEYREFYPYGGFMTPTGEVVHVGGKIEGTDKPKSVDLINLLRQKAIEQAIRDECKAVAVIFDVRIKPPGAAKKSDAIQVCLDHHDDYSVEVLFPYSINADGLVTYSAAFAQRGGGIIFAKKTP